MFAETSHNAYPHLMPDESEGLHQVIENVQTIQKACETWHNSDIYLWSVFGLGVQ